MSTTATRRSLVSRLSRWVQLWANARTITKIRTKSDRLMGMDMLVLHTLGRRSGQSRLTPLARADGGDGSWLVVASGGGERHPDWFRNLLAHPERAAVEMRGTGPVPVEVDVLGEAERSAAWPRVVAAVPQIEKYQAKSDRTYPVVRLTAAEAGARTKEQPNP